MFDRAAPKRDEVEALRAEIERLRAFVETRVQAQENMVRAMSLEGRTQLAESLEERIDLAAREAIAFAERGLLQHEAALRAIGRRVSELSRVPPPAEPDLATPSALNYSIGVGDIESGGCRKINLSDANEEAFHAALANLPILPGGASKLVAGHIVEHVPTRTLTERILPHWRERLAPGGELVIVTWDGPAWAAELARCADDLDLFRARIGADGAGRPIRNLFDAQSLTDALVEAGFAEVKPAPDASDANPLRMVVRAKRP